MAYQLTEDNKIIVKRRRLAWVLDLLFDISAFVFCVNLFKDGKNIEWFDVALLYCAYWMIMFLAYRSKSYSEYVMDEYGITRKFWKYEKFYFWGQFATKQITYAPDRVVFSVLKVDEKELDEAPGLYEIFSPSGTLEFMFEEESVLGSDLLYVNPEVFFHKMKEWNVDIEIPSWYNLEE